jgi:integrase
LPQTRSALKRFVEEDCFGSFSQPSMRKSLLLAADKLRAHQARLRGDRPARTAITPYHLRHTFGTLLALYVEDERALQELLLCSLKQVRRYTAAATDPRVRVALEKVADPLKSGEAGRKLKAAVAGNFGNFSGKTGATGVMSGEAKAETKRREKPSKRAVL